MISRYFLIGLFFLLFNCKDKETRPSLKLDVAKTELAHAKGFEIKHHENFTSLIIKSPWPESKKTYHYALVHKNMASKVTLNKDNFDGIITVPIEKMVVTSTTHIPALELLEVENTLIGFPGTDYISSEKTRARVDNDSIRELGKNEGINTEVLLEIRPDVVIGFGMDNNNKSFDNIKKAGIPVIYNGDWVEHSPLAKAEWIKFFGVLYNKRTEADSIYNTIEKNYLEAKALASDAKNKPSVLSGAMHKDMWYLPNGTSTEAQILKDAHVDYLWSETEGVGSLSLNFEVVFEKAKNAQLWINPSYYTSYEALEKANPHYTKFEAFKNKNMYTFANTKGATGGVLYYELGIARPDLVLKDIIKVCHPELLENYTPYFFKPLE
ncbi:ABC transporter substrate-binding protein [Xanthomarina sp. F2636L]|nr:ABC transporter substrate-binding protein [Xanthomarina sp. F2636L]MCX7550196.1 ABC transporter substrate-binding protein [Xanthomarina sp. F2636L]